MNQPYLSVQTTISDEQRGERDTRLHGRWLFFARFFWGVIAIFELAAFVDNISGAVTQLRVPCTSSCTIQQLSAAAISTLQHAGLSLGDYIAFYLAVILISTLLCYTIAAILLWRRSDDWMALLVSLMLLSFGPGLISIGFRFSQWFGPAVAPYVSSLLDQINLTILLLVFFLFPNGRFEPRWTRWFIWLQVCLSIFLVFFPRLTSDSGSLIAVLGFRVILISPIIAQVYRYRRVSTPAERQQTKWVVYSLVVSITAVVALLAIFQPLPGSLLSALDIIANLLFTLIPISFAVALLRYRLWDIDIIINRTLVYSALTIILTGVYVGLVIGLQALLRGIINQGSGVAIVISTLVIYFLFQPLRRGIQRIIDRRFYRSKYDAAKIIEAFSATLRAETDLDQLREQLLAVVQETMQPAHVSLWLRPPAPDNKRQAIGNSTSAASLPPGEES